MHGNNGNGTRAVPARGFMALCAMVAMGLGLMASPAEAAPFAYVANEWDSTVSVIDTGTNPPSVVANITVNPYWSSVTDVAVTPDGTHAYVTARRGHAGFDWSFGSPNNVSVIDTATNTVVATVSLGDPPGGVAVTPDGKRAYVTQMWSHNWLADDLDSNNVWVIDTASNTLGRNPITVGSGPLGVAVTPDGKHAYVTNYRDSTVSVIGTGASRVVATITVGGTPAQPGGSRPTYVAVTPDGKHAFVTHWTGASNAVSVIDTASNTVAATILMGPACGITLAVTPDGNHAYVANNTSNAVSVLDTATNMVVATVPVGITPGGVAVTPDGKHVYVANQVSNNVSVIDTATNTVVATVPVGRGPGAIGIVPPLRAYPSSP